MDLVPRLSDHGVIAVKFHFVAGLNPLARLILYVESGFDLNHLFDVGVLPAVLVDKYRRKLVDPMMGTDGGQYRRSDLT